MQAVNPSVLYLSMHTVCPSLQNPGYNTFTAAWSLLQIQTHTSDCCTATLHSRARLRYSLSYSIQIYPWRASCCPHTKHWGVLCSLLSLLTPNWTSCRDNRRMFKKGNCFSKQLKMLKQTTDTPDISGKIAHPSNGFLWLYGWNLILFEEMHRTYLVPTSLCKKMGK